MSFNLYSKSSNTKGHIIEQAHTIIHMEAKVDNEAIAIIITFEH